MHPTGGTLDIVLTDKALPGRPRIPSRPSRSPPLRPHPPRTFELTSKSSAESSSSASGTDVSVRVLEVAPCLGAQSNRQGRQEHKPRQGDFFSEALPDQHRVAAGKCDNPKKCPARLGALGGLGRFDRNRLQAPQSRPYLNPNTASMSAHFLWGWLR